MNETLSDITIIVGIIFFFCGILLKLFPPKNINSYYGYRTATSKQNEDMWLVANKYSAKLMILQSIILTSIGFSVHLLPNINNFQVPVGIALIVLFSTSVFVATEKHLTNLFDKDGNRKQ